MYSDDYTSWAKRKRLFVKGAVSAAYEVRVTDLILGKQPKSGGAWEHRRYIAEHVLKNCVTEEGVEAFLLNEVLVCERVCRRHPRTYFAWSHRAWVAGWMNATQLEDERQGIRKWIMSNLSDGSAFNHLALVNRLYMDRSSRYAIDHAWRVRYFMNELEWCSGLCLDFPGHESMWMYRRAVNSALVDECVDLIQGNFHALARDLKSIEVEAKIDERTRFRSYDWWVLHSKDRPHLDCVFQVVMDELAYALRVGLWQEMHKGEFNAYLANPSKLVFSARKHALAFVGWLSDVVDRRLLVCMRDGDRKSLGPGCLSNIGLDELISSFKSDNMTKSEFVDAFGRLSRDFNAEEYARLFDAFDADGSGELSRTEFLSGAVVLCSGKDHGAAKVRKSFELLDVNGNGALDQVELFSYCVSVFRVVATANPELFRALDIEALAKASVADAFLFSATQTSLTCEEFCRWLQSTTHQSRLRPSAIERYSDVIASVVQGKQL